MENMSISDLAYRGHPLFDRILLKDNQFLQLEEISDIERFIPGVRLEIIEPEIEKSA
mgnify:CR=1 FL=1